MEAEWRDLDNSSCWTLGRQGPPTGLTAIVSDTAGQREVAEQAPDAVLLWPSGDASALAVHIDTPLGRPKTLQRTRAAALQAAERLFCWERQEEVLLEAVARALHRPSTHYLV
jgi:hypothetical protein